ncbi:carbohydrate porin [Salinarimonas soli]|uniref:Carbohydrate porin n=1 Tax=Salinarimonas soli TaxID=1638099 RepID=A0A5B2VGX6_9HYPH|nr:carbohydrate porin [Salinarimonas soli]KAA2237760.1 carbohydrate porin [Salinarimonas soli]
MPSSRLRAPLAACLAVLATGALAQAPNQPGAPQTSDQPAANSASAPPSIQSSLGPAGDPGGVRSFLSSKGIDYSLTYIGEVLRNARGGSRTGTIGQGRFDLQIDADLDRLLGWKGAAFHTNLYQIHGTGLSRYYVNNLLVTSGIEALPSTRLYELWLEQKFLEGAVAIRAGQLAADTEFFVSQTAGLFVNSTFGWPGYAGANLPSGGPAYPLATPGVRVKLAPTDGVTLMVGLFNGDPAGPANDIDPQRRNRRGTTFRVNDPPFLIAEGAYAYGLGSKDAALPGTVKVGYWHHFARFDAQRYDALGLSLADPSGTGIARRLPGNDGVYAIVDQTLYRPAGAADGGLSAFLRLAASPGDRNLISAYADAGLAYKGLLPGRPNDTAGIGVAYARISDAARGLDRDTILFTGTPGIVRSREALVEVTYQAEVVPGWTVQPNVQYIARPGGGIANPRDPDGAKQKDAVVFGARTTIRY